MNQIRSERAGIRSFATVAAGLIVACVLCAFTRGNSTARSISRKNESAVEVEGGMVMCGDIRQWSPYKMVLRANRQFLRNDKKTSRNSGVSRFTTVFSSNDPDEIETGTFVVVELENQGTDNFPPLKYIKAIVCGNQFAGPGSRYLTLELLNYRDSRFFEEGQDLSCWLATETFYSATYCAASAVASDGQGSYVMIVDRKTGIARRQDVEPGVRDLDVVEISSGLSQGQKIVSSPLALIKPATPVKLLAIAFPANDFFDSVGVPSNQGENIN